MLVTDEDVSSASTVRVKFKSNSVIGRIVSGG